MPDRLVRPYRGARQGDSGQHARRSQPRSQPYRRNEAVDEIRVRRIAAVPGEDQAQHRHPEHDRQFAVAAPEAWPCSSAATADSIALAKGAKNSALPAPASTRGGTRKP
jgi:hypothetical protein